MQAIAIVGMACRYPDARSPQELWENALAQRRAFRTIPKVRLNLDDYYHPDRNIPDRTYSSQGAFLTDYVFNREHFRISGATYRSSDLTHWLALDIAERAFADAGFPATHVLPTASTGVLVGNTLTGEFSRAQTLRLRWPYVARVVTHTLLQENWQPESVHSFLVHLEQEYKRPFAPVGEETLAGGLSNTIAGRICNYFDLKGGGYTVDGACSSSLLAIVHACKALEAFDIDVALAGGVDLSIDPFEIIGFAKTSALASEEMRIYDLHSNGFLPGEGCGFVVLMRYEEALAQKHRIYALIRGWGISSDGSGGITRPEVEGQHLALTRAYRHSGLDITMVPYFEGHGTGTEVGDRTELQALTFTQNQVPSSAPTKKAHIGSIKANIGHTKAAAGSAGLMKAAMALFNQIIPPTTGMVEPHRELARSDARLQALRQGKLWPSDLPLIAGVSSMGFGGINAHIVLEGVAQKRRDALTSSEQKLLTSFQDAELFLLRAHNVEALLEQIAHLLSLAPLISYAELTDLAAYLADHLQPGSIRAALVASKPAELEQQLKRLQELLSTGISLSLDPKQQVYLGCGTSLPRIAFLFPGQGSPAHLDGGILRFCFPEVDTLYSQADLPEDADGRLTEIAQPAITTASLAGLVVLEKLGLQASVSIGHSLGELTALHWAGVMDASALLRIARARGAAMAQVKNQDGTMLSVRANAQTVADVIQDTPVVISGLNSPLHTVISGDVLSINKIATRLYTRKIAYVPLSVSHAFHSPLVAPAVDMLATCLQKEHFAPPRRSLISTVTGDYLEDEHIAELLCKQVTAPVQFLGAIERVQEHVDLFIEVGPGQTLAKLLPDITAKPVIATDVGGPSLRGVLSASAAAFALGADLTVPAFFSHRFTRPIDLNWNPSFLVNPCEQAPLSDMERLESPQEKAPEQPEVTQHPAQTTLVLVQQIIANRTELPLDLIEPESRMLSDLHLNSITVGQILAKAGQALGIEHAASLLKYADARLGEIVQALEDAQAQGTSANEQRGTQDPKGLSEWIRCFSVLEQEQALSPSLSEQGAGDWQIFAPRSYPLTQHILSAFASIRGIGCIVCLPVDLEARAVNLLLEGAQATLARQEATHFVLIQHGGIGAGFARTLSIEYPHLTVCILHLPEDLSTLLASVVAEVKTANGFVEASYDAQGRRTVPTLVPCAPVSDSKPLPLGPNDVLLVTGGGKGIAAECAFALAQESGLALALLGRSQPQRDAVLAGHLARLEAAGIRYRYIPVDVRDTSGVVQAVREIEAHFGPVTAILHGAGTNAPMLLSALDEEAISDTLGPKVGGLQNILTAISPQKIRYLITFGSVIARTGMAGEAHYALANEWLGYITETFQSAYPSSHCLCIEWSVWTGIGMGESLGRVEALRAEGITPIPVEEGLALFRQLLSHRQTSTRIVVCGRLGAVPTLKVTTKPLPFLRFLEKPRIFYPNIELIADAEVSTTTDLYLDDHQLQNERLVPAVVGLEAMAQAAQAVTGKQTRPSFKDLRFTRPLVVSEGATVVLRVMALVLQDGSVELAIRSSETAYQVNHFQALCTFEQHSTELESSLQWPAPVETTVQLQLPDDLYGQILFHQGRFQRIQRYTSLHARECSAEITPYRGTDWFSRYLPQELVLGDPAIRDAFIHVIQACIPQATLLPVGVESLRFAQGGFPANSHLSVSARELLRQGNSFFYDVEVRNSDGVLVEQWHNLHLQLVGETVSREQWAAALFGPYLERCVAEYVPYTQPLFTLHREADDALTLNQLTPDRGQASVHSVREWGGENWPDLLSSRQYALAEQLRAASGEPYTYAVARILALAKLLQSTGFPPDTPLTFVKNEGNGWQMLKAGSHVFLTLITQIRYLAQPAVFTFYCPGSLYTD